MQSCCFANLRPGPHVSVFIWKRNFFFTDTAFVHTYPMKTINENGTFRKRFPEWKFLKTLFSRVRVDRRKRNFSKALRTHYQFQSSPRNIRNLFKVADGRFPSLSFIECFHSRGQHLCKFIGTDESVCIRKEFTSQKVGLGHQHDRRFIVLGHQWKTSQQYKTTPKKFKEGAN